MGACLRRGFYCLLKKLKRCGMLYYSAVFKALYIIILKKNMYIAFFIVHHGM